MREREVFLEPRAPPEPQRPAPAPPQEPEERRKLGEAAVGVRGPVGGE